MHKKLKEVQINYRPETTIKSEHDLEAGDEKTAMIPLKSDKTNEKLVE
ncbi:unnamed protein product [Oikopleura dioica]|uniref:Uncharacterized protein n=1 Tax=Oikopleura dioica TaxID=34765 RepID=E4XIL1_OIKDI|nr:unnamed protein product [Oikopleura dioica]